MDAEVLSTRVEINRRGEGAQEKISGSLHPRGDQPALDYKTASEEQFSPPAWRSTDIEIRHIAYAKVLSTRVEINRTAQMPEFCGRSSLHPRGDQPDFGDMELDPRKFSPPAWRSTAGQGRNRLRENVLSTHVEIRPLQLKYISPDL